MITKNKQILVNESILYICILAYLQDKHTSKNLTLTGELNMGCASSNHYKVKKKQRKQYVDQQVTWNPPKKEEQEAKNEKAELGANTSEKRWSFTEDNTSSSLKVTGI